MDRRGFEPLTQGLRVPCDSRFTSSPEYVLLNRKIYYYYRLSLFTAKQMSCVRVCDFAGLSDSYGETLDGFREISPASKSGARSLRLRIHVQSVCWAFPPFDAISDWTNDASPQGYVLTSVIVVDFSWVQRLRALRRFFSPNTSGYQRLLMAWLLLNPAPEYRHIPADNRQLDWNDPCGYYSLLLLKNRAAYHRSRTGVPSS